jgi:uncharacterized protein (DUF58 family)
MSMNVPAADERPVLPEEVIEIPGPYVQTAQSPSRLPREGLLWLFATLVLFLTGLFKGINLLVLLAYLLAGIWLLNQAILKSSMRRLRGLRIPTGPIFADEPVDCAVELACAGKRPVRGVVVIERGDVHNRKWFVLSLKPGTPLRIWHRETFSNRGRYTAHALRGHSSFPFGLAMRSVEFSAREEWIVLPRLGCVRIDQMRHWLARISRGDGRLRRRHLLPSPQEADIHGLRGFRPGDSPRWIHWKTSARRNQLLVREFEDSAQRQLVLVVEPWLPLKPSEKDRVRLEILISLAGTIVRDWCRDLSTRLTLIIGGSCPTVIENGTGSEFVVHLLEVLAVEAGRTEVAALFWLRESNRSLRSALFLVLSSKSDSKLPADIGGELGRPVAHLDPSELPAWYERPFRKDETGKSL